jgi:hypothetical protein
VGLAIALGALLGLFIARRRSRRRPVATPPHDVATLLRTYRHGDYEQVVKAAPGVMSSIGAVSGPSWRGRVELVWGHSLFELDRYDEAIPHLRNGLDESPTAEAAARFRHCLGYAQQMTGRIHDARQTYEDILDDLDLDPKVRAGVERNLAELDDAGSSR